MIEIKTADEQGMISESAKPTIEVKTDRYNYTESIPILHLSQKPLTPYIPFIVKKGLDKPNNNLILRTSEKPTNPYSIEALKALKSNTADFFEAGEQYGVDPYFLVAVAILESGGGQSVPPGSFNPFGRVCGKGYDCISARDATTEKSLRWIKFRSWKEAIFDEAEYLRIQYLDRGLITPQQINQKYAEDKDWYKKIEAIIERIKD